MKGSPLPALQTTPVLVLAAGHGGSDPGACVPGHNERDECIGIVNAMEAILRPHLHDALVIAPHTHDTHETIPWLNARYPTVSSAWAIEVHRDSSDNVKGDDASLRCGLYYGESSLSRTAANLTMGSLMAQGAHRLSWTRSHRDSPHRSLGFIRQPRCLSHILELAFMEGRNDPAHLQRLARMAAGAVLKVFAGITLPPSSL